MRRLGACLVLAMIVGACSWVTPGVDPADRGEAVGGPPVEAEAIVGAWLAAASQGTGDRGWSLLYPNIRTDLFGSEDRYRAAIEASDWSSFRYRVLGAGLHDGEYLVRVEMVGTVPAFFEGWGVAQMTSANEGIVVVRLGVGAEPSGIQAIGGPASSQP